MTRDISHRETFILQLKFLHPLIDALNFAVLFSNDVLVLRN